MARSRRVRGVRATAAVVRIRAAVWREEVDAATAWVRVRLVTRVSRSRDSVRDSARVSACSRVVRRLAGVAFLGLTRAMVRVGLAGSEVEQNSKQASKLRAAVATFWRMSNFWRCGGTRATFRLFGT
jgi:hypothetical protein